MTGRRPSAVRRYGLPDQILTDNGKVFTGRFGPGTWRGWTTALGPRSTLGTGNGAAGITSGRKPSDIFHDHVACTFRRDRKRSESKDHRPRQPDPR